MTSFICAPGSARPDLEYTIEPDYDADYDQDWNGPSWCPEGQVTWQINFLRIFCYFQFGNGFQQKTDSVCSGGGECTGLNSVGGLNLHI